jgi:UDP-glucose 4-epimerase
VTLEEQIRTIVDVFSPKDNPSPITYAPDKVSGGGCLMNVDNAKEELGYEPQYDVRKLFEDFKEEMKTNRFYELRSDEKYQ